MKQYVCIKDYVTSEGQVAFKKGKIYDLTSNGMLYSELIGVKYYLTEQFKKINFKRHKPVKSFGGKGIFDVSKINWAANGVCDGEKIPRYTDKIIDNPISYGIWNGTTITKDVVDRINWTANGTEMLRFDANGNIVDSVVESVIKKFKDRSRVGIEKYNTTLDRTDIDFEGWAEHLQQELMDAILYLERLKKC